MKTSLTTVFSSILFASVLVAPVAQAQEAAPAPSAFMVWLNSLVADTTVAAPTTEVSVAPLSDVEHDPNTAAAAGTPPAAQVAAAAPAPEIQVAAATAPKTAPSANPAPAPAPRWNLAPRSYSLEDLFGPRVAATPTGAVAQDSVHVATPPQDLVVADVTKTKPRKKANMKTWKSKSKKKVATVRKSASGLDPKYDRTEVNYETKEKVGTIIVDTKAKFLYLIQPEGKALRWGVGVARPGFEWTGVTRIKRKVEWPTWTPPAAMRKREPWLPARMEGGLDNPLGARAMYLYRGGRDTLYRIHGTNVPSTIGKEVSSGCIRLINDAVADLYERTKMGAKVIVL